MFEWLKNEYRIYKMHRDGVDLTPPFKEDLPEMLSSEVDREIKDCDGRLTLMRHKAEYLDWVGTTYKIGSIMDFAIKHESIDRYARQRVEIAYSMTRTESGEYKFEQLERRCERNYVYTESLPKLLQDCTPFGYPRFIND